MRNIKKYKKKVMGWRKNFMEVQEITGHKVMLAQHFEQANE